MTKLLWGQVGERVYEAGVDRGVLYLADGSGVAWTGLTSVDEDFGGDGTSPTFFDGVKTRDTPSFGDFSATLNAYNYPNEFLNYEGAGSLGNGLFVSNQDPKMFGLSYRTLVGNDIDAVDHGYKIHILYNLTASSESKGRETLSDSPVPLNFSWRLSSVPQNVNGYRPTAHVIFDSTQLTGIGLLGALEDILYGTDTDDARLPTINELIDFAASWDPRVIEPDLISGLARIIPGMGDITPAATPGFYVAMTQTRLTETSVPGVYQLI